MTRDVEDLQVGFMQFFRIVACANKLMLILGIQFVFNISDGADAFLFGVSTLPMVVILLSFIAFIRAREAKTVDLQMKLADSMFDVAASAKDTITNYRLIADYFQRPAATERFLRRIRE